ncbi:MAG: hypothetical protein J6M53_07810 [Bacteroidaceae bacterium]|nr:hypothetical protein [Bacteroidaceae bacterium]
MLYLCRKREDPLRLDIEKEGKLFFSALALLYLCSKSEDMLRLGIEKGSRLSFLCARLAVSFRNESLQKSQGARRRPSTKSVAKGLHPTAARVSTWQYVEETQRICYKKKAGGYAVCGGMLIGTHKSNVRKRRRGLGDFSISM